MYVTGRSCRNVINREKKIFFGGGEGLDGRGVFFFYLREKGGFDPLETPGFLVFGFLVFLVSL